MSARSARIDMVNFGPRDTVPEAFRRRNFVIHNPQVTLMRTTRDENVAFGRFIGERLNAMQGPVRFLLPEGGVSLLDQAGKPFHDPDADAALFETIEKTVTQTGNRRSCACRQHQRPVCLRGAGARLRGDRDALEDEGLRRAAARRSPLNERDARPPLRTGRLGRARP